MAPSMTRVRAAASILEGDSERFASGGTLEAEAGDFGGIGVFHVEIADRFGGAVAFFDEEFDVEAFTLEFGRVEAAVMLWNDIMRSAEFFGSYL